MFITVKREHDVKESILFMAKQSGKLDPDVSYSSSIGDLIILWNIFLCESMCPFSTLQHLYGRCFSALT